MEVALPGPLEKTTAHTAYTTYAACILILLILIVTETLQKFEKAQIFFYSLYLIAYSL